MHLLLIDLFQRSNLPFVMLFSDSIQSWRLQKPILAMIVDAISHGYSHRIVGIMSAQTSPSAHKAFVHSLKDAPGQPQIPAASVSEPANVSPLTPPPATAWAAAFWARAWVYTRWTCSANAEAEWD